MGHLLLPLFLAALDIISTAAALLLSAYLRFDIIVPEKYLDMLVMQLPSFIILTLVFALLFKLYDRIWRYAGSSELLQLQALRFARLSAGTAIRCLQITCCRAACISSPECCCFYF